MNSNSTLDPLRTPLPKLNKLPLREELRRSPLLGQKARGTTFPRPPHLRQGQRSTLNNLNPDRSLTSPSTAPFGKVEAFEPRVMSTHVSRKHTGSRVTFEGLVRQRALSEFCSTSEPFRVCPVCSVSVLSIDAEG